MKGVGRTVLNEMLTHDLARPAHRAANTAEPFSTNTATANHRFPSGFASGLCYALGHQILFYPSSESSFIILAVLYHQNLALLL